MPVVSRRDHRLFSLSLGIALFVSFANACQADGMPHCDGTRANIAVDIPFHDIPISIGEHRIGSEAFTLGSILATNEASVAINEVDIQIEYRGSGNEILGALRFGATTGRPRYGYFKPLKGGLAPGQSISLDGTSLRIFPICPPKARLAAIRVQFSDGSEFTRAVSPWSFHEFPLRMPRPQFPTGSVPQGNSAYLLQLSFSVTGEVEDVQQFKSGPAVLPKEVIDELREWRLEPGSQPGKPEASKILAVIRIENGGLACDAYTCPIPFLAADLYPAFLLIDLVHSSTTAAAPPGFENYDLYFGGTEAGLLGGPGVALGPL